MIKYKEFLIHMCEAEKVSIKELQVLTGESETVVKEWFDLQNPSSFPSQESLTKILFRLGISMDDFSKCKSEKLDDYHNYRIYNKYIGGYLTSQYISESILDDTHCYQILNAYVEDCAVLRTMINEYLDGKEIDKNAFDKLCKHIQPSYYSDVVTISDLGDGVTGCLDFNSLIEFKYRNDILKEMILEDEDEKNVIHNHGVFFPDAYYVIFKTAQEKPEILKKYLDILNDIEKNGLMGKYIKIYMNDNTFDKNKEILKCLVKNNCTLNYVKDEEIIRLYNELMLSLK